MSSHVIGGKSEHYATCPEGLLDLQSELERKETPTAGSMIANCFLLTRWTTGSIGISTAAREKKFTVYLTVLRTLGERGDALCNHQKVKTLVMRWLLTSTTADGSWK